MKTGRVAGAKELQAKFCPECGKETAASTYGIVCAGHNAELVAVLSRTLKYSCRVCGAPAANMDKYCRYCGLEHL